MKDKHPSVGDAIESLRAIGREFHGRGWSLGTSSNYSVVVSRVPFRLLITASGRDKGSLTEDDFSIVDEQGKQVEATGSGKPSAETLLHVVATERADVGAVLHTHSVWATCLSDWRHEQGMVSIEGYEMLKGLEGIKTHDQAHHIHIFQNTQDIAALSRELKKRLDAGNPALRFGFLLRRHGLYAWGKDLDEARRHVEVFEFLFEVIGRTLTLGAQAR